MNREILVDFNALPRVTRERLVNSTGPTPTLAPLVAAPGARGGSVLPWAGLGALCLLVLYGLVKSNFGHGELQHEGLIILYVGAVFFFLAAVLLLLFQKKWRGTPPFHPGRYVFPRDFVDASARPLRIIPLSELAGVEVVHHHSRGNYRHSTLTLRFHHGAQKFQLRDQAQAQAQFSRLQQLHTQGASGTASQDESTGHESDLFFEVRSQPGGLEALQDKAPADDAGGGPLIREPPRGLRQPILLGLAFALSLGVGSSLWWVRNRLSDDAAFEAAKADSTGRALTRHASYGGRHAEEARELGLQFGFQECERVDTEKCWREFTSFWPMSPKSEEARLERKPRAALKATPRTVDGLNEFLQRYPGSVVDAEVRERLLPAVALQELPANTVTELRRFRRRYPRSSVDAEVQSRIHQLFATALTELQGQASTENPQVVAFMHQLLTYLENTERSQVTVGFRSHVSPSLQRADLLLRRASQGVTDGDVALVSGHLGASNTGPLESQTVTALANAFRQVFSADLFTLELGEHLPEDPGRTGVSSPRLDIDYTISWSGMVYKLERSGRQFAGIQFDFDVTMRMPGAQPVHFSLKVKPPKDFQVQYARPRTAFGMGEVNRGMSLLGFDAGPNDSVVYNVMAQRAFDELGGKLGQVLFRPDSKAFQALNPTAP
ncbi:hypothetical protein ATI61_104225 [Archangium gephyra]|uniref:Uncharacterized protein n=1 Tax=Archangium gephyra TaxID=48 RepID=A0AAC8Q4E8_9BACT|nr:hypothetical protein [Archangium gephyra]AKJ00369.1 Hypothetical protein AA314_01995 [Archangium gephyra]REG32935.1 hypothetical protein ATI61_104225 [Archangium gephyra]